MTALDEGGVTELFVTNVLGGIIGKHHNPNVDRERLVITSSRSTPRGVLSSTKSPPACRPDRPDRARIFPDRASALADGTPYVADTLNNRITAIPSCRVPAGGMTGPGAPSADEPRL